MLFSLIATALFIACGAAPGLSTGAARPDKNLPSFHYQDANGNLYDITGQKLIYTPVSATNTIDGIKDEGLYTELNISQNEYAKIAAVCQQQLGRNQNQLKARAPGLPLPFLKRDGGVAPKEINIDYTAVNELNYILEPFLKDE